MSELNEELLKCQDEWLRRMARHLVGPSAAADDLAQETWVAGLNAGTARMTMRPWLFRVLSNKASGSLSERRRAGDALHMVQRESGLQSLAPDQAVADLELRERVLREVHALDEPLRTAIHQVYFLGRSTREAGKELGVSRSTVSERAQKGLDELRARLDREYGGDRESWAALLVPAIGRGATVGPAGAAIQGGSATASLKVAGAVVLLAGAGWLARTTLVGRPLEPASPGTIAALPLNLSHAEARGPREFAAVGGAVKSVSRTSAQSGELGARNATVTARFLLPSGEPAAGGSWSLGGSGANEERVSQLGLPDDWETLRGTLDADGNLLVSFDPPQALQFFLTVWDEGVVAERWRWGHVRPDERKELGTVQFMEASRVRGFVVDEMDQPIVGRAARVRAEEANPALGGGREARQQRVELDPITGSFVLDAVPSGSVRLSVSGGLKSLATEFVEVDPGATLDVRLPADPQPHEAGRIHVKARLGAFSFREAPLPLESVWIEAADGLRVAAADYHQSSRTYLFDGIPEGPLTLVAEHPAIEPARVEQPSADSRLSIDLVGRSSIVWTITDTSGVTVDSYSVELIRHDGRPRGPGPPMHDGTSPLPGHELNGLWPGTYTFMIRTATGAATVEVPDLAVAEARPIAASLAPIITVTGRLVRPNGDPVHGETVRLILPAEEDDSEHSSVILSPHAVGVRPTHRRCTQRTYSGEDGRFAFVVEDPGRYLVVAGGEMRPFAWSDFLELEAGAPQEPLTLTLEEPSGIVGSFMPPAHLPPRGWLIQLEEDAQGAGLGTPRDKTAVDDEGRFSIPSLAAGEYRLYATLREDSQWVGEEMRPLGAFFIGSVEVHAGQTAEAPDLRIESPVPASVTVTLPIDEGVNGPVFVSFRPLHVEGAWASSNTKGTVRAIEPAILEPGTYALSFSGTNWRGFDPREFTVPPNQAVSITVPLEVSEHRVRLIRGGEPLRNARVTLSSPANESHRWSNLNAYQVDAEGWVEAKLSSGTWKLFVIEQSVTGERPPGIDFAWPPVAQEFAF